MFFKYILIFIHRMLKISLVYLRLIFLVFHGNSKIKYIKNIYLLNRKNSCIIIGNGPSLTGFNFDFIQNKISFASNSIAMIFNKTDWRPNFYFIQDKLAYSNLKPLIDSHSNEIDYLFSPLNINKVNHIYYNLNLSFNRTIFDNKSRDLKFSKRPDLIVYDGYSVTYSMIQFAIYFGFKTIFLLGIDNNYDNKKNIHFLPFNDQALNWSNEKLYQDKSFLKVSKIIKKKRIRIVNLSPNSQLKIFPFEDIENV